jgi:hypothetical protein
MDDFRSVITMKANAGYFWRWTISSVFLLFLTSALSAQSGRGWMKGIVLGLSDSQGMSGAVVELTGDPDNARLRSVAFNSKTEERGQYSLQNIPYGDYTFKVSAPGFIPYEIKLYIPSDAETQVHVRLRKEKGANASPQASGNAKRILSYDLQGSAWTAWKAIDKDWMENQYWACLKKFNLKMSCAGCENIYIDVELHINAEGRLASYKILKENICSGKITSDLEQAFLAYFKTLTFPESLRNLIIEARLGTGLKC